MARPKGRPSLFDESIIDMVYKLCLLGATDAEMADIIGIDESTFNNWKHDYPELLESIKKGKEQADANVACRLYQRAMGYEHDAVKILQYEGQPIEVPYREIYPPDTTAAIFWLKNRRRTNWRDRTDVEHSGSILPVDGFKVTIDDTRDKDAQ